MSNQYLLQRLAGIQSVLSGVYKASDGMSSASRGLERAAFIDQFLSEAFPAPFRFGTGDVTDASGKKSGQVDVVVEYPFMPSLPISGKGARLYLAESVAAVVEVKSDAAAQWSQAIETAAKLSPLERVYGASMTMGPGPTKRIPFFIAGYTGWKQMQSLSEKLASAEGIDGILVIDSGLFVSLQHFGSMQATGPWSLWALICCIHQATTTLKAASTNPIGYAL